MLNGAIAKTSMMTQRNNVCATPHMLPFATACPFIPAPTDSWRHGVPNAIPGNCTLATGMRAHFSTVGRGAIARRFAD